VRIGEVASNVYLVGFDAFNEVLDNHHILLRDGIFLHLSGFVERQVEGVDMAVRQPHISVGRTGLFPADPSLQESNFRNIHIVRTLFMEKVMQYAG
jgi:hypothetical protein